MAIASLGEIAAKKLQTSTMSKLTEQMTAGNKSYMAETVTRSEFKKSNRVSDIPIFKKISKVEDDEIDNRFKNSKVINKTEKEFRKSFYNFCKNFGHIKGTGSGIYMSGDEGTGKTYYTNCIYHELCDKYVVYKTSLQALLDEEADNFKNPNVNKNFVLDRFERADLVIFDDLGNEMVSDWMKQELYRFFSYLCKNRISFIINTNLNDDQLKNFMRINGSAKLFSRIRGRCKYYKFEWEDRRIDECKEIWDKYY